MIDNENLRLKVVKKLKNYLQIPIIRGNQNAEPPKYPYLSYNVTTVASENNGTYGEYSDGIDRKPVTQTWSITVQSDDESEALRLALKARDWLDHIGRAYLSDNHIIVQSITSVTSRDSILTIEYEYKKGFDIVFWLYDEIENPIEYVGEIKTADIKKI